MNTALGLGFSRDRKQAIPSTWSWVATVAAISAGLKEDLCADCDLIVEAAFEDMGVKQAPPPAFPGMPAVPREGQAPPLQEYLFRQADK